ncbi:MAG: acetolactate decarboxylase [Verrucomicrobiota bacterium]
MKHLLPIALFLVSLAQAQADYSPFDEHQLVQYSTIDAFLAGVYDGDMRVSELKEHGDFGIGTFNGVDGELLMIDGTVYQIPASCKVRVADADQLTPFVTVTFFKPENHATLAGAASRAEVESSLENRMFKSKNVFYAFRFDGTFTHVKARAPRKQKPPYPLIKEVMDDEAVFHFRNIKGTMIGFWCPTYLTGLTVPGWHMHFISEDKKQGGHVLDYSIGDIKVAAMQMLRFQILLPRQSSFLSADLDLDRAEIMQEIETEESGSHAH